MLITFDLDEVLILNPFGSGVFPHVQRVISESSGADPRDVRRAIVDEARWRQREGDFVGSYDWDDIIRTVSARFRVPWTIQVSDLVKQYAVAPHIALHAGAKDLLTYLRGQGYILRALTNGYYAYQYPVLQALGIAGYFDCIVTPQQVGWAKPQREYFQAARRGAALPHVHIGDHAIHDVWGANRVGAISVWVYPKLRGQLLRKTPRERALDPSIIQPIQESIDADLCPDCHPDLTLAEAVPRFVVVHLSEVREVITCLASERARPM